jgi:hypothetical protein
MDLLSWFRRIPGHDINVRIPSSPHLPHSPTDTVESSPTALDLFGFPDWNFSGGMDISIPIRQVIPVEAAKGIPSKRVRDYATPPGIVYGFQYRGTSQPYYTFEDDYAWEMNWQREEERRATQWTPGNWWSWGFTDETIPLAYTSGLW